MGAIRILCDKCGADLLPGMVVVLNDAHGTELTAAELPALAEMVCLGHREHHDVVVGHDELPAPAEMVCLGHREHHDVVVGHDELPAPAEMVCLGLADDITEATAATLEDLGLFLVALLAGKETLCDDCAPLPVDTPGPGRLN